MTVHVLHVLPVDVARGAQTYARLLRDRLDGPEHQHRTLTLFAGRPAALRADHSLRVPDGRLRRLGFDPRAAVKLRRWLRRERPDAVIVHGGEPLRYARLAVPRGTRLVYYRIGVVDDRLHRPLRRLLYRLVTRRCDAVAGVSQETLDDAATILGIDRRRLRLIPNGRDPDAFAAALPQSSDGGPARLCWIGHLTDGKRPDWFVDVVAALRRRGATIDAVLVGDGPLEPDLRAAARAAGVDMLGRRDDVPALLAAADILCFTSAGVAEGLPGVLIEAGLSARPVVATRVAGVAAVIDDGVTGLIVDRGDFDGFVGAVATLVADPARAASMGAAARTRCLEHFTLDASANLWRTLLAELLAQPRVL